MLRFMACVPTWRGLVYVEVYGLYSKLAGYDLFYIEVLGLCLNLAGVGLY